MELKRIVIIGGGISGLAALHYLKGRLPSADITLFEREAHVGGTVRTVPLGDGLLEWGPNGFLNNQPATLELIEDLDLTKELIEADAQSSHRYVQIQGQLHQVPANLKDFIRSPLLSWVDKWAVLQGLLKRNVSPDQSVYDYVAQRFGANAAKRLADPFISGVYAGDIKRLHMRSAFSHFSDGKKIKSRLLSLRDGMGRITQALFQRYQSHIQTSKPVMTLHQAQADAVLLAVPSYAAAKIIAELNPLLADLLKQVYYAPIAVVGLLFDQTAFVKKPTGFGYLVASSEAKDVLGVLMESNVFPGRAGQGQVMMRVMLGGTRHPGIAQESPHQILAKALKEINTVYGLTGQALETFVKVWPQAIPQYGMEYPSWLQSVARHCYTGQGIYLCANYLGGISFNDCIASAKSIAGSMVL